MPNVNSLVLAMAILSRARFSKTPIDHAQTLCEIEKPKAASGCCLDGLPANTSTGHRGSRDSRGKIDKLTRDPTEDCSRNVVAASLNKFFFFSFKNFLVSERKLYSVYWNRF